MAGDGLPGAVALHQPPTAGRRRVTGTAHADVKPRVKQACADGSLKHPDQPAISFRVNPWQTRFSDTAATGRRAGPRGPLPMVSMPYLTPAYLGLDSAADVNVPELDCPGDPGAELI